MLESTQLSYRILIFFSIIFHISFCSCLAATLFISNANHPTAKTQSATFYSTHYTVMYGHILPGPAVPVYYRGNELVLRMIRKESARKNDVGGKCKIWDLLRSDAHISYHNEDLLQSVFMP